MKSKEAEALKKLIDSFVENEPEKATATEVEVVKERVKLTSDEEQQLFRSMIPEGFSWEDAKPIRSPLTQDRVFLQIGNERRWVPDLETLQRIGYALTDVENIDDEEMKKLKEGFGLLSVKIWEKKTQ